MQQRASAQESRSKDVREVHRSSRHDVQVVAYDSSDSENESSDVFVAEFVWPSKAKSLTCDSLKPVHKNRQDDVKFTFDAAKCYRIFTNYIRVVT